MRLTEKTMFSGVALCLCILVLPFCRPEMLPILTGVMGALIMHLRSENRRAEPPTKECGKCEKYLRLKNGEAEKDSPK